MGVLKNSNHERFAQAVVAAAPGENHGQVYVSVFGPAKGADQSASRLLRNAQISARVAELQLKISSNLLRNGLRDRENRLDALQKRWEMLMEIVRERGFEYVGLRELSAIVSLETGLAEPEGFAAWRRRYPMLSLGLKNEAAPIAFVLRGFAAGGATGYMVRDYKGLGALMPVYKVDTGLLGELRAIEAQIARELGELNPEPVLSDGDRPKQINVVFVGAGGQVQVNG